MAEEPMMEAPIYKRLRGEPPTDTEIIRDEDRRYVPMEYKEMPIDFAFELEQKPTAWPRGMRERYDFHRDGSGPLEMSTDPMVYPGRLVHEFIKDLSEVTNGDFFNWRSQWYDGTGNGSHNHLRPREGLVSRENLYEAWATAYNTINLCSTLIYPMWFFGRRDDGFVPRAECPVRWAELYNRRCSVPTMRRKFFERPYHDHPRHHVAWNKKEPPLTIEIRLTDTMPTMSYEACILMNRITRECFDRGYASPKLRNRAMWFDYLDSAAQTIARGRAYQGEVKDLYDLMRKSPHLNFYVDRSIPKLDDYYDNALDCMKDILINYGHPYPPMGRVCAFFLQEGIPYKSRLEAWRASTAPVGEFSWDQEGITP